jgi:hypothetical protein
MYQSDYETQATIRLHRQAMLHEAEQERLLDNTHRAGPGRWHSLLRWRIVAPLGRTLVGAGRWLVSVGTKLETRYADGAI